MIQPNIEEVIEFLRESNAIERVYDDESLDNSIEAWEYLMSIETMTPAVVRNTHQILMKNPRSWSEPELLKKYIGQFRDCPVYIGGKEAIKHVFIQPSLESWCSGMNMRGTEGIENKEGLSIDLHVEYEHIHPFVDGNGRTGRMFMNWERLQNGIPIWIIHEGYEQMQYYKIFK